MLLLIFLVHPSLDDVMSKTAQEEMMGIDGGNIFSEYTLSQTYPRWNWKSKLNTKLRLEIQVEYRFKLEFQVE